MSTVILKDLSDEFFVLCLPSYPGSGVPSTFKFAQGDPFCVVEDNEVVVNL